MPSLPRLDARGVSSSHDNDNLQGIALQGCAGPIAECTVCHTSTPNTTGGGPHGLHSIGRSWVSAHRRVARGAARTGCQACQATDYRGTVLSAARTDRSLNAEELGTRRFSKGTVIGCYSCHNGPDGG